MASNDRLDASQRLAVSINAERLETAGFEVGYDKYDYDNSLVMWARKPNDRAYAVLLYGELAGGGMLIPGKIVWLSEDLRGLVDWIIADEKERNA